MTGVGAFSSTPRREPATRVEVILVNSVTAYA